MTNIPDAAVGHHPNATEMLAISERLSGYRCVSCGTRSERIDQDAFRWAVWAQTPLSVIHQYLADGYSIHEAIAMEMSYA
jgi:hypothetical protein